MKSKPIKILAIETSCDETAAAVVTKNGGDVNILSNIIASQINIHKKYGGVFPEIASRAHTEKIIPVVERALNVTRYKLRVKTPYNALTYNLLRNIDVIAITIGPGLIGSLLIGVNFAKTLAYAKNLPIIGINHLLGHIYSNWAKKPYPMFPALILIVSGGHTGLYLMKSHNNIQTLGETLDDAAGEAFDKVAKLLGLGYPGGPAIADEVAKVKSYKVKVTSDIKLPRSMLNSGDYNFSFSGLKTAVLYKVKELSRITCNLSRITSAAVAASFQQTVLDILIGKTIQAAYEFKPKSICLCGGVSANKELRQQLKMAVKKLPSKTSYHIPPIELSTDNAAMIGIAASYHLDQVTKWDNIHANANLKL